MARRRSPAAPAGGRAETDAIAARAASRHFGRVGRLDRLEGGATNAVYAFRAAGGRYVLRLNPDAAKVHDFFKEQWAIDRARAAGVPAPAVMEVGSAPGGSAYMIQQRVDGVAGDAVGDRCALLRELGGHARRLHAIRTAGEGGVFDWSRNRLSKNASWSDFLVEELRADQRLALLRRSRLITPAQARALGRLVADMQRWQKPAVLQHGDLRLKNTLVEPGSGRIVALVDWEHCLSGPAPYWDLSIALHDLGIDDKEALLQGYGLAPRRLERIAPYLGALNLLNYAAAVEAASLAGDSKRLDWLRLRLRGGLDLYRLPAA